MFIDELKKYSLSGKKKKKKWKKNQPSAYVFGSMYRERTRENTHSMTSFFFLCCWLN
jgi:hypothetical protein